MTEGNRQRVKSSSRVERWPVSAGFETEMQILIGPEDGAPAFTMRRFIMGPGGGMPLHTNAVEHEQFVLSGRAEITIGDQSVEVESGDVVYIAAGEPHAYRVLEAPFEFLCVVPNREDRIELVESETGEER